VNTSEHAVTTLMPFPQKNGFISKRMSAVERAERDAYGSLFQYISSSSGISLSEQEKEKIAESTKFKQLSKRQYFLEQGEMCKHIGFIVNGATRMFSINERGDQSVIVFSLKDSWIADHDSFKNKGYSSYHIEALEDTELILLNSAQKDYLKLHIPAVAEMFSRYDQQQLVLTQKRINMLLCMTAEERYAELQKNNPEYGQRFSQKTIAAYLGIKQQSLCRIRRRQL
ncbi:MAG: Crp/Fnr family transcriptional regulator, partial [Pedobacter sp.]